MAVSKVTLVNNNVSQTLIDVSNDTAVAADVAQGKTFHLATGEQAVGTATGTTKPTQTKTATPSTSQQTITPDAGYELASVTVEAVTNAIDANIQAGNIRNGVSILGVTGNYGGGGSSTLARELIDRSITTLTASDLSGITSIGDYAFMSCQMLTSVTLSNDVTYIGNESFSNCTSLTSVPMTNNITSVGMGAFTACTNITIFNWSSSCTTIPSSCFSGCGFTQVTIPDTVTNIESYAFSQNPNLETITLGSGISQLGDDICQSCSNLDYVTIMSSTPPQCNSQYPFDTSIMFIRVPDAAVATYQSTWPWSQYTIQGLSAPIILTTPASEFRFDVDGHITNYIGSRSKVVTPTSYDKVSTSTTFNGVYAYLENFASQASSFGGLQVIISADGDINNAVTFDENDIGTAASQFGSYAYIMGVDAVNQDYSNLSNISWLIQPNQFPVYVNGTILYDSNQWNDYWNNSLVQETKVFYGTGTVISYTDGNTYSVTQIDNDAFTGGNISNLTVSEGVTYIGANFSQNGTIQKVKFPSTLTDLGYAAFAGCPSLYTVEIAQGNTNIIMDNHIVYKVDSVAGTRTLLFALCGYGGSISLYNTVTGIRDYAFSGSAYGSIQINNIGTITLGSGLFSNSSIQTINFTNMTDTINISSDSFTGATSLQTLTLPPCGGSGSLSLNNLTALYSVDISRSGISNLSLTGLANLGTITIPASVTSITGQISNCPNLTVITVDATTPPMAQSDCFNQSNVNTVYVPQGTLAAYQAATGWSTRNLVEQGGPTPPVGGPYATIYFDNMGSDDSRTENLSQLNYILDFANDVGVFGVDIGMTAAEWRNAGGQLIGAPGYTIRRQYNSGTASYVAFVSDGTITIPSARIPESGQTSSGTVTLSLNGVSETSGTATITESNGEYTVTIVPRTSPASFVQITMDLTNNLRENANYYLDGGSVSSNPEVTVYRDNMGTWTSDGSIDLTQVNYEMPTTINGQSIGNGDVCIMNSAVNQITINDQPYTGLFSAYWMFDGSDAEAQNIDFTISNGASLNYSLGNDPSQHSDTHFVFKDYNGTYQVNTYNSYPGSIGYAKLIDNSNQVITSGSCEMYYMDPVTTSIYWKITDTNNVETYVVCGNTRVGGDDLVFVNITSQPQLPDSANDYVFNQNSITRYLGQTGSASTPVSYDTSQVTLEGATTQIGNISYLWASADNDGWSATFTVKIPGESNSRVYNIPNDTNDLENLTSTDPIIVQSIVMPDDGGGTYWGYNYVMNTVYMFTPPFIINNTLIRTQGDLDEWMNTYRSNTLSMDFSGTYTDFVDGYSTMVNTIANMSISASASSMSINDAKINEGITTISANAFANQSSMTNIELPSTIQTIGNSAFTGCSRLTNITILATTPPTLGTNIVDNPSSVTIYVPAEALSDYQNDSSYSGFTIQSIQ